jgi:hypothetical protein
VLKARWYSQLESRQGHDELAGQKAPLTIRHCDVEVALDRWAGPERCVAAAALYIG